MNIENYSLDCFLRQSGYDQKNIAESPRDLFITPGDGASRFQRLMSHDGYSILSVNQFGDVAAINESGSEAGYYSGSSLVVHEEHRRNGLAVGNDGAVGHGWILMRLMDGPKRSLLRARVRV